YLGSRETILSWNQSLATCSAWDRLEDRGVPAARLGNPTGWLAQGLFLCEDFPGPRLLAAGGSGATHRLRNGRGVANPYIRGAFLGPLGWTPRGFSAPGSCLHPGASQPSSSTLARNGTDRVDTAGLTLH